MNRVKITLLAAISIAMAFTFSSCGGSKANNAAAARGYETVQTPASELDDIKREMESKYIPCGIGMGESTDEMIARNVAGDEARTDITKSMGTLAQRISEQYAQNVSSEGKKIWEEGVRQITDREVNGATSYKTITQYNPENNRYKIYSLYVMNPDLFKKALMEAAASQEEFELRVKKDDMMKKLDEGISEYQSKYKK